MLIRCFAIPKHLDEWADQKILPISKSTPQGKSPGIMFSVAFITLLLLHLTVLGLTVATIAVVCASILKSTLVARKDMAVVSTLLLTLTIIILVLQIANILCLYKLTRDNMSQVDQHKCTCTMVLIDMWQFVLTLSTITVTAGITQRSSLRKRALMDLQIALVIILTFRTVFGYWWSVRPPVAVEQANVGAQRGTTSDAPIDAPPPLVHVRQVLAPQRIAPASPLVSHGQQEQMRMCPIIIVYNGRLVLRHLWPTTYRWIKAMNEYATKQGTGAYFYVKMFVPVTEFSEIRPFAQKCVVLFPKMLPNERNLFLSSTKYFLEKSGKGHTSTSPPPITLLFISSHAVTAETFANVTDSLAEWDYARNFTFSIARLMSGGGGPQEERTNELDILREWTKKCGQEDLQMSKNLDALMARFPSPLQDATSPRKSPIGL